MQTILAKFKTSWQQLANTSGHYKLVRHPQLSKNQIGDYMGKEVFSFIFLSLQKMGISVVYVVGIYEVDRV